MFYYIQNKIFPFFPTFLCFLTSQPKNKYKTIQMFLNNYYLNVELLTFSLHIFEMFVVKKGFYKTF